MVSNGRAPIPKNTVPFSSGVLPRTKRFGTPEISSISHSCSDSQGDSGSIIDRPRDIPTMPNRRPANDVSLHLVASCGP